VRHTRIVVTRYGGPDALHDAGQTEVKIRNLSIAIGQALNRVRHLIESEQ